MNEVQFISSSSNINTNNLARRYSSSTPSSGGLDQSLASLAERGMSASSLLGMGGHGENYFDLTIDDDDDTPVQKGSVTDDDRNCSGVEAASSSIILAA